RRDRPFVRVHDDFGPARIYHRLDCERHPRQQLRTASGSAEIRYLWILVVRAADAVADEAADDREAGALDNVLDRMADVGDVVADARLLDPGGKRLLADVEQPLGLGRDLADPERIGAVGDQTVERDAEVDRDHVTLRGPVLRRDPVHDHRVRRDAERRRVAAIALRGRYTAALADVLLGELV